MAKLDIEGCAYAYGDEGTGRTVVLLHGFPLDRRVWDGVASELASTCRVIRPDLRGFGETISTDAFTIKSLAADVHALLTQLRALPCVLAGLSMGGYVAQAFAEKYLDDVSGLILVDTKSDADTEEGKTRRNASIALARTGGAVAIAEQMKPDMLAPDNQSALGPRLEELMHAVPALTLQHALAAMRDRPDYAHALRVLHADSLVIVGAQDKIAPPDVARLMLTQLRRVTYVEIENAGHMSPLEQPRAVAHAVATFVARLKG